MAVRRQGGGEIGEADRLRPHRCSIEIADGRLDEKDLHGIGNAPTIAHGRAKPIVERIGWQILSTLYRIAIHPDLSGLCTAVRDP